MTRILSPLIVGYLNNSNYATLHEPFGFQSDVLKSHKLKDTLWGPAGFVFDFESTPNLIRGPIGENKRGGTAHDIACRIGACPGITKSIAADVYFEIMEYCDSIDTQRFSKEKHPYLPAPIIVPYVKTRDWLRRLIKSNIVRIWPGDYFQKYELTATAKEIYGIDGDPYCTMEKLDAAIAQSEKVTDTVKSMPLQADNKELLINKTEAVTEELKDTKAEIR